MNPKLRGLILPALGWAIPPDFDREAILGDLEEEHSQRLSRDGRPRADAWLVGQFLGSLGPLLNARVARREPWHFARVLALAWLTWVGALAMVVAASVSLFRLVSIPAELRILTYVSAAFLAAAVAGHVAQRLQATAGTGARSTLAGILAATVGGMFALSPESEPVGAWLLWTVVLVAGVFTGAHGPQSAHGRSVR